MWNTLFSAPMYTTNVALKSLSGQKHSPQMINYAVNSIYIKPQDPTKIVQEMLHMPQGGTF